MESPITDTLLVRASIQHLIDVLQAKLHVRIVTGQITLNLCESRLQSVETRTHQRIGSRQKDDELSDNRRETVV